MKNVVVTGASSGIGKAISQIFSSKGWSVTLLARSQQRLQELAKTLDQARVVVCDLSDPQAIQSVQAELLQQPIDALINNAGIFVPQAIDADEDSVWEQQFQTNLMGAVRLTRLYWPSLKQQKGCILNISSTLGVRPIPNTAAYSASKAAMNNWTQSLALEGAPYGIRANAICPGIVDTPIHSYINEGQPGNSEVYQQAQGMQPLGRTGKPNDIAFMAYQFCQPEAQWMTGTCLNIDGGILLKS